MMMKRALLAAMVFATGPALAAAPGADELPRRVWHGVALHPAENGIKVLDVTPGGAAAAAQLQKDDVIVSVNGVATPSSSVLTTGALRTLEPGATVTYRVRRGGAERTLSASAPARPPEAVAAGLALDYGVARSGEAKLRTLVTRPAQIAGKAPAFLIIQGYVCSSIIDAGPSNPYRRLSETLAQEGFVVMRAEKPNVGDSRGGPACEDMDLDAEAAGFRAAFEALKARPDVDPAKVFIFGHSLGGVTGPMFAREAGAAGVAVYGITPTPWFEYLLQITRAQGWGGGGDAAETERVLRVLQPALYELLVRGRTPQEVVKDQPAAGPVFQQTLAWDGGRRLLTRDVSTLQDLNSLDQTALWTALDRPVLAMHGTADVAVTFREGPRAIARMSRGTYCEFDGLNHGFARAGSLEGEYKAMAEPGAVAKLAAEGFSDAPFRTMAAWARSVMAGETGFKAPEDVACGPVGLG
jgi:uncharacterized protein